MTPHVGPMGIKQYLIDGLASFNKDAATSPFQRGYEAALRVVLADCFYTEQTNKPEPIKAGDIVMLKSGGPNMTVDRVITEADSKIAYLRWFVGHGEYCSPSVSLDALVQVRQAQNLGQTGMMSQANAYPKQYQDAAATSGQAGTKNAVGTTGTSRGTRWDVVVLGLFVACVIALAWIGAHR